MFCNIYLACYQMDIHIRSMDVSGYRYTYEGFYEKTSYQMAINRGIMTTTQGAIISLVRILSFLLFLTW